jgi:hypothetical protein
MSAARTETIADAARRIRKTRRIVAERATDDDCAIRRELIDAELARRGIPAGEREWFTAQLVDGRITGVWAQSAVEAELQLSVWWETDCHWVVADTSLRLRDEYFPHGKRSSADAQRTFPIGPPRRIRDRFAPADPLLDTLGPAPAGTDGAGLNR